MEEEQTAPCGNCGDRWKKKAKETAKEGQTRVVYVRCGTVMQEIDL